MDTQISLCHKRSIRPTFFVLKNGVEIQSKRSDQFVVSLVFSHLINDYLCFNLIFFRGIYTALQTGALRNTMLRQLRTSTRRVF